MKELTQVVCVALGAFVSGCAMINANIAHGDGPEAVAAVSKVDSEESLRSIARKGKNEQARIAAAKKMSNLDNLAEIVKSNNPANEYLYVPTSVRTAAMERIDELGATEKCFANGFLGENKDLVDSVADEKAMPPALRMKALKAQDKDGYATVSGEVCGRIISDRENPMELRIVAAEVAPSGSCSLSRVAVGDGKAQKGLEAVFNEYMTSTGAERESAGKLLQICYLRHLLGMHGDIIDNSEVPLDVRKLFYLAKLDDRLKSTKQNRKLLKSARQDDRLKSAMWAAGRDVKAGKVDSDNCKFVRWAIANTKDDKTLKELVESGDKDCKEFWCLAAANIADDEILSELVDKYCERDGAVAAAAYNAIKDEGKKKSLAAKVAGAEYIDICLTAKTAKERADALKKLYAESPEKAVSIVSDWFVKLEIEDCKFYKDKTVLKPKDILAEVDDLQMLCGMLKASRQMKILDKSDVQWCIKERALELDKARIDGMAADKLDKIVDATMEKASKFKDQRDVFVLDNAWIGMPTAALYACAKREKTGGYAYNWDVDDAGKQLVVTKVAFAGKGLYKATGLEKSMIVIMLPEKFGVAPFQVDQTKITMDNSENQQFYAEITGDYSKAFKGGDVYWTSETQAKGVKLTYWDKKGLLVMESL